MTQAAFSARSRLGRFGAGLLLCALANGQAQEVGSRWRLRVLDLQQQVRVDATIRFARDAATESCMAGRWKRLVVETNRARDERFFPLAEPLAYDLTDGRLTFGRTGLCDGYLFLSGTPDRALIAGSYHAVSIGGRHQLGSFTLHKVR